jgi:hypothetical protein
MRFDIARSLNGNNIIYIARDTGGIVRFREEKLENLQEAIKNYNLAEAEAMERRQTVKATSTEPGDTPPTSDIEKGMPTPPENVPADDTSPSESESPTTSSLPLEQDSPQGEQAPEEQKKRSSKKSFWDKLK